MSQGESPLDPKATSQTVAAYLSDALAAYGVTHVFELVGGMITVLLDSLHSNPRLTIVSAHHEQGAGFMAEGFARTSGVPAVAMATSGPGATNLLTPIASCYFDSVPVVFITGQVNTHELSDGRGRQRGFQETDVVAMATPVCKFARMVLTPQEFPAVLARAFTEAVSGRPGPVLIDIPMDVQRGLVLDTARELTSRNRASPRTPSISTSAEARRRFLGELEDALAASRRPLIVAGGGIRSSGAVEAFRELVEAWKIPVVTSLMGKDAIPGPSDMSVGFLGSYGNRWANWSVAESDLLLVLGSRLDVRQTGSDVMGFRGDRAIFHVDIDHSELNNHVGGCTVLADDLSAFLPSALTALPTIGSVDREWLNEINRQRDLWPDTTENVPADGLNPNVVIRLLQQSLPGIAAFVTDVGQHQMWAAQSLELGADQRFLTSGGLGSMGFGLPASIGTALALGDAPTCMIAGDGGFQCNIQELQTVARLDLNLLMVVMDNGCHGMVRQFQESYFEGRYHSTRWGYSAPEFCEVSAAYGIPAIHIASEKQLHHALSEHSDVKGPRLLHIEIDGDVNAFPKMAFGRPFGSMEPDVSPLEMEGT